MGPSAPPFVLPRPVAGLVGRSFVMLRRTDQSAGPEARRLAVVLNWFTEVRARLAKSE